MKLIVNDDKGLFPPGLSIPYYSIILTKEEAKIIEGKLAHLYEIDGHQLFDIKDKDGNLTGEKMISICWFGKI